MGQPTALARNSSRIMLMPTSPITCVRDTEIELAKLGVLLSALATSDETASDETNFFDESWASDVPKVVDPNGTSAGPVRRRIQYRPTYHRVVAIQDNEYVGFLAGRFEPKRGDAFVAIVAALRPGSGCGPELLDTFAEMASSVGLTRLRLKPDHGDRYDDRVRFFKNHNFDWCEGETDFMCRPLVGAETDPAN